MWEGKYCLKRWELFRPVVRSISHFYLARYFPSHNLFDSQSSPEQLYASSQNIPLLYNEESLAR